MKEKKVTIVIERSGESKTDAFSSYDISITEKTTLLDGLLFIKETMDPTLTFRRSCESGICGSCAVNCNGRNALACETHLWPLKRRVTVKPLPAFPVIRDLVVDLSSFYEGFAKLNHPDVSNTTQSVNERKKLDGLYECIHCAACSSSCPVYWRDETFVGPAVLLKGARDLLDSRKENTKMLQRELLLSGLWECRLFMNCVKACSKGLNPLEAIVTIRNRLSSGKKC